MYFRIFLVTASSAEGIPAYRAFLVSPSFSASTLKAVFPLPGDANDDGNVTVTDIAVVVNEILQLPNTDIVWEYTSFRGAASYQLPHSTSDTSYKHRRLTTGIPDIRNPYCVSSFDVIINDFQWTNKMILTIDPLPSSQKRFGRTNPWIMSNSTNNIVSSLNKLYGCCLPKFVKSI